MIAVLAGGVGAARFLQGLVTIVPAAEIVVVGNTGDDIEIHGLHVSPDLDTVTYTLSGASNSETGWGIAGDTFRAIDALERYESATWFRLGDIDLATHIYRTERLAAGATLSEVTAEIARAWGIGFSLLPMSDDRVRTKISLASGGEVDFQDYFVRLRHEAPVAAVRFSGAEAASAAPGVLEALEGADVVVLAPSNPVLSIGPILAVPGVAGVITGRRATVVAVSPIVAGRALKGPADHLLTELGHEGSAFGVARLLSDVVGGFVLDVTDADLSGAISDLGMRTVATETVMRTPADAAALAKVAIDLASSR